MSDSGRSQSRATVRGVQGLRNCNNGKKRPSSTPYIGDPQLFRRVDKYLDEKADQDVIDKEAMVEDLRNQYKEYGRRNKTAFRNAVFKAFEIVMQASMNTVGNASDMDISSDDSDDIMDDDLEDSELFNNEIQNQLRARVNEAKKNNGAVPYIQVVQKMVNSSRAPSSSQELINISSSDEEEEEVVKPTLKTASKIHDGAGLLQTVEMPHPRINLPPGTKLLSAQMPSRDTVTIIRKRKPFEMITPSVQVVKRQKMEPTMIPKTKLTDFGGNLDAVKSICRLVLHMKHPEIYRKLGVSPPRGFLLHGPPGSGKTLLAHAIAGELSMPLLKVAAPELVGGVSGESELRIRELFEQAKSQLPCVLFIDEVDCITPRRDTAQKDMERRIVSQLLASLDELSQKQEYDRVLVIGATNRPDSLDPAMRRAGRFDREICLGIPDKAARISILSVVCSELRLSPSVSLDRIASLSPGYVGADLKALTSEAAIMAVNRIMALAKKKSRLDSLKAKVQNEDKKEKAKNIDKTEDKPSNETKKQGEDSSDQLLIDDMPKHLEDGGGDKKESEEKDCKEKMEIGEEQNQEGQKEEKEKGKEGEKEEGEKEKKIKGGEEEKKEGEKDKKKEGEKDKKKEGEKDKKKEGEKDKKKEGEKDKKKEGEKDKKKEGEKEKKKEGEIEKKKEGEKEEKEDKQGNKDEKEKTEDKPEEVTPMEQEEETCTELTPRDEVEVEVEERPEAMLHSASPLSEKDLEELYIEEEDFIKALKVVQPSAKREGFATVPDVTWEDIGSLQDIRDQLQMSIMMPVKYPTEFAKLSVSSPTGILLCGPPGCGKTLLAKAVANEANINFISVKGPELLNMYVGESERAVRQCFQRARNSHPCVIFFDELDALCPKRSDSIEGSASSRVVNQLLTEMDGVEGRTGVFLMAATNRPDMIDPAVMRPGRFDKILYVGLPQAKDRADILKALTKNGTEPPFAKNVNLTAIGKSKESEGYTGADLAALVKEASVQALTQHIANNMEGNLLVKKEHICTAFSKIRPSVSVKDQNRYEALRLQYTAP